MYQEEDRITPYDGAVEIPKEIQTIRDPIIFNLTRRELFFVTVGMLLAALSVWVLFKIVGVRNSGFLMVPVMVAFPFGLFAFVRPMGLNLEDWLTIWMSNNLKSAPVRKLFARNEYERVLEIVESWEGKQAQGKHRKGMSRKKKQKKRGQRHKRSSYQVRR